MSELSSEPNASGGFLFSRAFIFFGSSISAYGTGVTSLELSGDRDGCRWRTTGAAFTGEWFVGAMICAISSFSEKYSGFPSDAESDTDSKSLEAGVGDLISSLISGSGLGAFGI